jgi:response regulator RpfG family c-di-GMP phosphodiesterase
VTWQSSYPASTATRPLPRVLLVDDDQAILDGLRRQLRRTFDVSTALGGQVALDLMEKDDPFAAVLSDMRMPEMDGSEFLARVRALYPDTVRLLLTGQADMQSTIAAINDGQIYRFLTKPSPPGAVESALQDAVALYQQVTAERDVLQRTLRGAVQALLDALSLASPQGFSRARRISQLVREISETAGLPLDWELEVGGMLAQLGIVTVPAPVLEKVDAGLPLTEDEQEMIDAVPDITEQLIAGIPRLEGLAAAIGQQVRRYDGTGSKPGTPRGEDLPLASRLLKIAVDIETMRSQRIPPGTILRRLTEDPGAYDPHILDLWMQAHSVGEGAAGAPVAIDIEDLQVGMVLAEDVTNAQGAVLLGRGTTVTETLVTRLHNHAQHGSLSGQVVVQVDGT